MDVRYLMQILLFILFLIGIYYISLQRHKVQYDFVGIIRKEECHFIYRTFSKHLGKKKICAYDKYQIWRHIEKRRSSPFIKSL